MKNVPVTAAMLALLVMVGVGWGPNDRRVDRLPQHLRTTNHEDPDLAPGSFDWGKVQGTNQAVLYVMTNGDPEVDWYAEAQVSFQGQSYRWRQGAFRSDGDELQIALYVDRGAWMADIQAYELSDLSVQVVGEKFGVEVSRGTGEVLRVAFDTSRQPVLLTRAQALELAPTGVYAGSDEMMATKVECVEVITHPKRDRASGPAPVDAEPDPSLLQSAE